MKTTIEDEGRGTRTSTKGEPAGTPNGEGVLRMIEVGVIEASRTNPRKVFPKDEEFVENVRVHGVVQPLIVRVLHRKGAEIAKRGDRR